MLGIALAPGNPFRGLLFVPVLVDVWRFVYILWVGFKEFYKFMKYRKEVENILF